MRSAFLLSHFCAVLGALVLASASAVADIYTCRHADGSTEITDAPCVRGATTVNVLRSLRPAAATPTATGAQSAQSTKPVQNSGYGTTSNGASSGPKVALAARVEPNTQRNRDDIRRRVLSNELDHEEKSLTDAKGQFNNGNVPPMANEGVNSPGYLDRRARLQQTVALHEKNVAAIRQELSNLR
jgi:hypothetical protein